MNLIVKRFFVLALPLLMAGSIVDGYSIGIENESGVELDQVSISSSDKDFAFGAIPDGEKTALGNADLQFGDQSPRHLEIAFTPKNGRTAVRNVVELPILGKGESVKLSINSYLDLIERS